MDTNESRSTIGLRMSTKKKLDKSRAPVPDSAMTVSSASWWICGMSSMPAMVTAARIIS